MWTPYIYGKTTRPFGTWGSPMHQCRGNTLDISDYDPRHRRAQVGIYIAPQARNQGFARVSLEMAATYCREILGIHGLYAMVAADNTISARLFSSAGYKTSGRLRSWLRTAANTYADAIIYQRLFQ